MVRAALTLRPRNAAYMYIVQTKHARKGSAQCTVVTAQTDNQLGLASLLV